MSLKLMVVSANALSAVIPCDRNTVGGAETRAWLLSRGLARQPDLDVGLCCFDSRCFRQPQIFGVHLLRVVEPLRKIRVEVSRHVSPMDSFPWRRIDRWKWKILWQLPLLAAARPFLRKDHWAKSVERLMARFGPHIVFSFGVNPETAAAFSVAQRRGIPRVLCLQSNIDLDEHFFTDADYRNQYGVTSEHARTCLELVDMVACQTQFQQEQLQKQTNVPSRVILNPVDTDRFGKHLPDFDAREHILWIGRYDHFHKRPLLAFEVAKKCPDIPFRMIINPGRAEAQEEIRSAKPHNVTIVDYVPNDQMPEDYRKARLYLSTGSREFEGFPNVFLEAAASGTPIMSLEDFNDFLEKSQAGIYSGGDVDQLAEAIRSLWNDRSRWEQLSRSGMSYVREHHSLETIVSQFRSISDDLLIASGRRQS